ncbi:MAG: TIGR03936 family radical SAM-associated protein [Chitinophagales bacterium]
MNREKVRVRLAKEGVARFISHLDFTRAFERAARRAGLPVALSEGFHPIPRFSFGPPLPVGATSQAEYVDLELTAAVPAPEVAARLARALPPGFRMLAAATLPPLTKPLMAEVACADYAVDLTVPAEAFSGAEAAARLLAQPNLPVARRAKDGGERQVDIRPYLLGLEYAGGEGPVHRFRMRIKTGSTGGARPEEYLPWLAEHVRADVARTEVWLDREGELVSALG